MSYDEEEASDNITLRPKSQNSEYDQKELNNYEEALSKIGNIKLFNNFVRILYLNFYIKYNIKKVLVVFIF